MDTTIDKQAAASDISLPAQKAYVTVTARVNAATKQSAQSVLEENGLTISVAVQRTLEYIARTGKLPPIDSQPTLSKEEIKRRLDAVRKASLRKPYNVTDDEIREMRLREKYGVQFND